MPPLEPMPIRTVGQRFKFIIALMATRKYRFYDDWIVDVPDVFGRLRHIKIPKGRETDLASFPAWLPAAMNILAIWLLHQHIVWLIIALFMIARINRVIFNPIGLALIPGLVHDELYCQHRLIEIDDNGNEIGYYMDQCTLWQADDVFRRLHLWVNDMPLLATITWLGLSSASFIAWNRYRKKDAKPAPDIEPPPSV